MEPEGSLPLNKCPPPVPVLRQLDPVHAPTSHLLNIHLNIPSSYANLFGPLFLFLFVFAHSAFCALIPWFIYHVHKGVVFEHGQFNFFCQKQLTLQNITKKMPKLSVRFSFGLWRFVSSKAITTFQCVTCCLHRDDEGGRLPWEPDKNLRTVCLFVIYLTTLSTAKTVGIESNFKIIRKTWIYRLQKELSVALFEVISMNFFSEWLRVKVKVNFAIELAMKAQSEIRGTAVLFL
jgi:hypothetical protein